MIPPCPNGSALQSFFLCVCKCQPQIPAGSLKCPCVQGTLLRGFIGCWSHWYFHWERWMTLQRSLGPSCFNLFPRTHGHPCHLGPCQGLKMNVVLFLESWAPVADLWHCQRKGSWSYQKRNEIAMHRVPELHHGGLSAPKGHFTMFRDGGLAVSWMQWWSFLNAKGYNWHTKQLDCNFSNKARLCFHLASLVTSCMDGVTQNFLGIIYSSHLEECCLSEYKKC